MVMMMMMMMVVVMVVVVVVMIVAFGLSVFVFLHFFLVLIYVRPSLSGFYGETNVDGSKITQLNKTYNDCFLLVWINAE